MISAASSLVSVNVILPLPIEELFGVGRATSRKLRDRGIRTIGDLANTDPSILKLFLKSNGTLLWNFANGRDESPVRQTKRVLMKGIGNSTTIAFDVADSRTAHLVLLSLTETVAARLREARYCARLVSVSIRTNKLISYSHQRKIYTPTDCTNTIYIIACQLFDAIWGHEPIRHLGVRVSDLCNNSFIQMTLFERECEKQRATDRTVDQIRSRYGSGSIIRATFLHSGLDPITGGTVTDEEYPMMTSLL